MRPPHTTPSGQPSLQLHIESLVLHGLPLTRSQGPAVQAVVEAELARLLAEQGLSGLSTGVTPRLSASAIQLTHNNKPAHVGHQIAQAIHGAITPTAASPCQTSSNEGASQ